MNVQQMFVEYLFWNSECIFHFPLTYKLLETQSGDKTQVKTFLLQLILYESNGILMLTI